LPESKLARTRTMLVNVTFLPGGLASASPKHRAVGATRKEEASYRVRAVPIVPSALLGLSAGPEHDRTSRTPASPREPHSDLPAAHPQHCSCVNAQRGRTLRPAVLFAGFLVRGDVRAPGTEGEGSEGLSRRRTTLPAPLETAVAAHTREPSTSCAMQESRELRRVKRPVSFVEAGGGGKADFRAREFPQDAERLLRTPPRRLPRASAMPERGPPLLSRRARRLRV
jgi:hypothetical protein